MLAEGKAKKKQASSHRRIAGRLRRLEAATNHLSKLGEGWSEVGGRAETLSQRPLFPVHAAIQLFLSGSNGKAEV